MESNQDSKDGEFATFKPGTLSRFSLGQLQLTIMGYLY